MRVGFRMGIVALLIAFLLAGDPDVALACSCGWNGPFLVVAPQSRMVVRGKVQGYHGKGRAGLLERSGQSALRGSFRGEPGGAESWE